MEGSQNPSNKTRHDISGTLRGGDKLLDKTKNQRQKVDEKNIQKSSETPKFNVRMAPERVSEYRSIVGEVTQIHETTSAEIDKALKSFWTFNKGTLQVAKLIQDTDFTNAISFWTIAFVLDFIETRLSNIETIVQGIAQRVDLDVPTLKSKVEALDKTIKEPAIAEVLQFVQTMKKKMEEAKRKQEKYVG